MAGRIPQAFINDLVDRTDLVALIGERVTLKKSGKSYMACCPFHDEKTPSFSVVPDKGFYHCFGCGANGTAISFLMEYDRLEFVDAVEALAKDLGLEVPREQRGGPAPEKPRTDLFEVMAQVAKVYRSELKASDTAIDYLKGRGLTGATARAFGIGYAPPGWHTVTEALPAAEEKQLLEAGVLTKNEAGRTYDRFRDRIVFPIRDVKGRVIGFGGRVLGASDGPKYINSPETPVFKKSEELYGIFEARQALRHIDRLILVEGYMDVVALAEAGFANAVATLGTASNEAHFKKLFRYAGEVVCCFDGDRAGRQAAWRAVENALPVLSESRQMKLIFLPDGEDPDSFVKANGKAGFAEYLDNALPAVSYLFDQLAAGIDLGTVDGQARLAGLANPLIERVEPGVLRDFMQRRLHELTGGARGGPTGDRRQAAAGQRRVSAASLSERLIAYLFAAPEIARSLDPATADQLAAIDETLPQLVMFFVKNPEAGASEALARWLDEVVHGRLLELANAPIALAGEALATEFQEGVAHYLAQHGRRRAQQMLDELRQAPNADDLARLVEAKRSQRGG